jgi:hypothetical protein
MSIFCICLSNTKQLVVVIITKQTGTFCYKKKRIYDVLLECNETFVIIFDKYVLTKHDTCTSFFEKVCPYVKILVSNITTFSIEHYCREIMVKSRAEICRL